MQTSSLPFLHHLLTINETSILHEMEIDQFHSQKCCVSQTHMACGLLVNVLDGFF